jgi:3-oxoacyl-[acyl-carrier protein] reductase
MDLGLNGKRAIVLGGTRGIGRAIAETLASEGSDVAICARNSDQVKEAVTALETKGVRATGASIDIADGPALRGWIEKVGAEFGSIDILVSNAGAMAQSDSEQDWEKNFRLDVLGATNAFQAARPFLEKAAADKGDAAFVIISSISAAEADNASSYGPIKAALIHYAKGLARQHAKKRVRTNVVSPGTVYFKGGVWNMIETNMPDYFKQAIERNPTGRMATPQEIASAAVFLASPVSSFTTGVNLVVDGGISRRVNF